MNVSVEVLSNLDRNLSFPFPITLKVKEGCKSSMHVLRALLSTAIPAQKVAVRQVWCDNTSPGLLGVQTVSGLSLNDPVIISDPHAMGDRGRENDREEINLGVNAPG